MKLLLALLLSTLCVSAAEPNLEPEGWPIRAHFPNLPTVKNSPPTKHASFMARATAQKDNATYGIQRLILRQTQMPRDVFIIYQSVKTSMLAGQSAKVVEEEKIMMCGLPGLRYVIEYKDGERRAEFRELLIEHDGQIESYQFMHDYSPTGRNLFEGKAFFESVKKVG